MEEHWQCPIECFPMPTRRLHPPAFSGRRIPSQGDRAPFCFLLQELKMEHDRNLQSARATLLASFQAVLESNAAGQNFTWVREIMEKLQEEVRHENARDIGETFTPDIQLSTNLCPECARSDMNAEYRLSPRQAMDRQPLVGPTTPAPSPLISPVGGDPTRMASPGDPTSTSIHKDVLHESETSAPDSPSGKLASSMAPVTFPRRSDKSDFSWAKGSFILPNDVPDAKLLPLVTYSRRIVRTQYFEVFAAFMIVLNVVIQAIAAEGEQTHKNAFNFDTVGIIFSVWFIMELLLRFTSQGLIFFFFGPEKSWNIFDTFVVSVDIGEKLLSAIVDRSGAIIENLSSVRILRILRIVRVLKAIRQYRFFKDFRMMVFSLIRTFMALFWSIMIFNICVFVFSVYLCRSVNTSLQDEDSKLNAITAQKLEDLFGSVRKSQFTLYKTVSGGVDWGEVADPLEEAHWVNLWVLCFYIFFTLLGVMNIITGIFVDRAIKSGSSDSDEVIVQQVEEKISTIRQIQRIFQATDENGSGMITEKDLADHLKNEKVAAAFSSIGIDINEAHDLFTLLDPEERGAVDIDVFVRGCWRLRGPARSIDLVSVQQDNKRLADKLGAIQLAMQDRFQEIKVGQQQLVAYYGSAMEQTRFPARGLREMRQQAECEQ